MEGTLATIMLFAADFAPKYWAFCNGATLAINTNTALFSLLGTTYGGNGTTTFNLPDFRGRTAVGQGQSSGSNYNLGQQGGSPTVTLTTGNLALHNHPASALLTGTSAAPNTDEAAGSVLSGINIYASGNNAQYGGLTPTPTGVTGASNPVNIQQPYLGMNYVICLQGVYPSRN